MKSLISVLNPSLSMVTLLEEIPLKEIPIQMYSVTAVRKRSTREAGSTSLSQANIQPVLKINPRAFGLVLLMKILKF